MLWDQAPAGDDKARIDYYPLLELDSQLHYGSYSWTECELDTSNMKANTFR